jgi:hypothetical protein
MRPSGDLAQSRKVVPNMEKHSKCVARLGVGFLVVVALVLQSAACLPAAAKAGHAPSVTQPAWTDGAASGQSAMSPYPIGNPTLKELYVAPNGNDGDSGLTPGRPLRTISAAWAKIPEGAALTGTGYRINLLPGEYPCEPGEPDDCQNYFANRTGTYQYPIILRAQNGAGTVTIRGGFDLNSMAYLYLLDLTLAGGTPLPTNLSGNNLLHIANSHHILLRGLTLAGPDCPSDTCNNLQEVLKVNQAQYFYVESSVIGGAWHSAVDYFSVQYGHFLNNRVHTTGQWGMYVKGGTAYLRVEGNEFDHCQLGFQAGQSSNLATMRSPWLHYEAYDIKFVNNVMHDLAGVGLSASGAYNVLFAYNTLYRVGTSTDPGYALAQAVQGERGCTATDELPDPVTACDALIAQGGWGPNFLIDNQPVIPNRSVYIYNNLIYNPAPSQTQYTHLSVYGPVDLPAGFQNIASPVATDNNLVIAGNLIWNGPQDHPLGIDESSGCQPSNPTCNAARLAANNTINQVEPQLVNPAGGNYRPAPGGNVFSAATFAIPDFIWSDAPSSPAVPAGTLANAVPRDRAGNARPDPGPPGAYAGATTTPAFAVYLPMILR